MTRRKKTRSLSRIHKVKTGSIAKFKRDSDNDRQTGKRLKNRRQASTYEKFLAENPEAKQKAVQKQQQEPSKKTVVEEKTTKAPSKPQEKNLLDQLDSKDFNDIY